MILVTVSCMIAQSLDQSCLMSVKQIMSLYSITSRGVLDLEHEPWDSIVYSCVEWVYIISVWNAKISIGLTAIQPSSVSVWVCVRLSSVLIPPGTSKWLEFKSYRPQWIRQHFSQSAPLHVFLSSICAKWQLDQHLVVLHQKIDPPLHLHMYIDSIDTKPQSTTLLGYASQ